MGSDDGVEEAGVTGELSASVCIDVVHTLGTLLWVRRLPVWADALALGRLSVSCGQNVSLRGPDELSAVRSSSMRFLMLLELI